MKRILPAVVAMTAVASLPMSQALADGGPRAPTSQRAATPSAPAVAPITPAPAPTPAPPPPAPPATPAAQPAQAPERAGPVQPSAASLANGGVNFQTPAGYQFYSADDARAYLQRAGAAEPPGQILGMVGPTGQDPASANFWGAVITYQDVGYVPATGGEKLSAQAFESEVRASRAAGNRPFEAFAVQPAFDPNGPVLTWAERTGPDAPTARNLRYDMRLLGRSGVAGVTVAARNDQLGQVVSAAPSLQSMLSFPAGQGYANRAVGDRTAAMDLPGLITGNPPTGVTVDTAMAEGAPSDAQKTGLFGGGLGGILPWIAGGVIALAGLGWYVSGRNRRARDDFEDDEDDGDGDADATDRANA